MLPPAVQHAVADPEECRDAIAVYAVIEVKTSMSSSEAKAALENLASVSHLEFRPALTPHWETQSRERDIHHDPPALYAFAFRTDCQSFETFAGWIDWQYL